SGRGRSQCGSAPAAAGRGRGSVGIPCRASDATFAHQRDGDQAVCRADNHRRGSGRRAGNGAHRLNWPPSCPKPGSPIPACYVTIGHFLNPVTEVFGDRPMRRTIFLVAVVALAGVLPAEALQNDKATYDTAVGNLKNADPEERAFALYTLSLVGTKAAP